MEGSQGETGPQAGYIVVTEFKQKHILEQHELFCSALISSGLKEKKSVWGGGGKVVLFSLRTPDPYFLLERPRPLSPPWGPWTSYQPT